MPPQFSGLTKNSDLSFISSEPSVVTSRSGRHFFVHSDIIGDLHRYTVRPNRNLDIDLSAWDDNTVSRWVQFLYSGDCQIPEPIWQEDAKAEEGEDSEAKEDEGGEGASTDRDRSNTPDTVQSRANRETCKNVLLLHAELYVLVHSVGPDEFGGMAFDRFSSVLHSAGGFIEKGASKPAVDFIETLAYTFNLPKAIDFRIRLGVRGRALVKDFAAMHFGNLMAHEEMSSLMRKNGDFAVQLMELVASKVREAGSEARNLKDQAATAAASREALQESIRNHEKIQASVITKYVDMWISKKEKEVLGGEDYEIILDVNDHLYSRGPWAKLKSLRGKLQRLYAMHTKLRQEFEVYSSKDMKEFLSFDTGIVKHLDSCLEAANKLFKSYWPETENSEELLDEYACYQVDRLWGVEAFLRVNLAAPHSTETESRPKTPLRPLEMEVDKTAHMLRWCEHARNDDGTLVRVVPATVRDAFVRCLMVRAAWLGGHAEWTRDKIEWYEARLLEDPSI